MPTEGYITLTFQFQKEGHRWVGICKQLGTSTYSSSLPEVEKQLGEAVSLHLNTLEDVGQRDRFFKEHGIVVHSSRPKSDILKVDIPSHKHIYIRPYIQKLPALNVC